MVRSFFSQSINFLQCWGRCKCWNSCIIKFKTLPSRVYFCPVGEAPFENFWVHAICKLTMLIIYYWYGIFVWCSNLIPVQNFDDCASFFQMAAQNFILAAVLLTLVRWAVVSEQFERLTIISFRYQSTFFIISSIAPSLELHLKCPVINRSTFCSIFGADLPSVL